MYVAYNLNDQIKKLDLNFIDHRRRDGGFYETRVPMNPYAPQSLEIVAKPSGDTFPPRNVGVCSVRPKKFSYNVYSLENQEHPSHSSRFSYGHFDNGYGVGSWSSGFYNTPACCGPDPMPMDMAPKRFYENLVPQ